MNIHFIPLANSKHIRLKWRTSILKVQIVTLPFSKLQVVGLEAAAALINWARIYSSRHHFSKEMICSLRYIWTLKIQYHNSRRNNLSRLLTIVALSDNLKIHLQLCRISHHNSNSNRHSQWDQRTTSTVSTMPMGEGIQLWAWWLLSKATEGRCHSSNNNKPHSEWHTQHHLMGSFRTRATGIHLISKLQRIPVKLRSGTKAVMDHMSNRWSTNFPQGFTQLRRRLFLSQEPLYLKLLQCSSTHFLSHQFSQPVLLLFLYIESYRERHTRVTRGSWGYNLRSSMGQCLPHFSITQDFLQKTTIWVRLISCGKGFGISTWVCLFVLMRRFKIIRPSWL